MKTSTTIAIAASMILSAGYVHAQGQQQNDRQNQQSQQYSNSGQPQQNQADTSSQQPQSQSQSYSATSPAQNSSGTSAGSTSQGMSQDASQSGSQANDSSSSQSNTTQSSSDQSQNDVAQTNPQPQTENGITYVCGGVGEEQASYMKQSKKDYDLMLTFATRNGDYLADVNVGIKDAKGQPVLDTTCGGPIMLINLPRSGTYRVDAKAEDYALHKTVKVRAKGHTNSVVMAWPRDPAETQGIASTGSSQEAGSSGNSESSGSSGKDISTKKKHLKHRHHKNATSHSDSSNSNGSNADSGK